MRRPRQIGGQAGHRGENPDLIDINGAVLFAFNSAELQPEGLALLKTLAAPITTYLKARDEILMVSGFTDDRQVRGGNHQFADNWELSAQRSLKECKRHERTSGAAALPGRRGRMAKHIKRELSLEERSLVRSHTARRLRLQS